MQTLFISYADQRFRRRQRMVAHSAIANGGMQRCIRYGPESLDSDFRRENRYLLSQSRGAGYWVWKPYIILDAMAVADEGCVIVYCDSGSLVTGTLAPMVEACRSLKDGILGFEVGRGYEERHWTKRDAFVLMDCDGPEYWDSRQMRSGTIAFRNGPASRQFVSDWLELVRQVRLVSDMPSLCGQPELEGFRGHRHDQSLFSLLYKKRGYRSCENLFEKHLGDVLREHIAAEPPMLELMSSYASPALYLKELSRQQLAD